MRTGETAPLYSLLCLVKLAGGFSPTPAPSVLLFYATSPFPEQNQLAWTASVVLAGLCISSIISRLVTRRRLKVQANHAIY